MYEVVVSVREDDSKMRTVPQAQYVSDISTLFSTENARDYDTN